MDNTFRDQAAIAIYTRFMDSGYYGDEAIMESWEEAERLADRLAMFRDPDMRKERRKLEAIERVTDPEAQKRLFLREAIEVHSQAMKRSNEGIKI